MLQRLRERMGRESGFTLVELLVVMLILGILAAIAIPSFFNQRDKARDAEAKTSAKTAQTAIETYATENNGSYAGATATKLQSIEETLNGSPLTVVSTDDTYTVTVTSDTTTQFSVARLATGAFELRCNRPNEGGCPSDSNWD